VFGDVAADGGALFGEDDAAAALLEALLRLGAWDGAAELLLRYLTERGATPCALPRVRAAYCWLLHRTLEVPSNDVSCKDAAS